jgi:hypothetical protein
MKSNRFKLLGLVFGLAVAGLALMPLPAHAFVCGHDLFDDQWTYYSSAAHTTVVGHCENDCGTCLCRGMQTPYYTVVTSRIC